MAYFPLFVDLKDKNVLVVGGGRVAAGKAEKLLAFGARITLVAPQICDPVRDLPGIRLAQRPFQDSDLDERPELVVAATDDREVNRHVSQLCCRQGIPVNVADDPALCTFLFPALVQKGSLTAGICTGGASPTASAYVKSMVSTQLPDNLDEILLWLETQRARLKETVPDQTLRGAIMRSLFHQCMDAGGIPEKADYSGTQGSVALVGAGCGKADLITLRGLRLLQQCQAVVYDELIDPVLLEAAPESALRIPMGKRAGEHSASQTQINETLIALARSGLRVVRLKGGDPYLFGRGGEEMLALHRAGIPCTEVPGIPSPMGITAEAGIPVTHRGMSRSLHIFTARSMDSETLPVKGETLAALPGTLVFLMGLSRLEEISGALIAGGKDPLTPAAVISGGNSPNPGCVRGSLKTIARKTGEAGIRAPAIIVVGDVAAMDLTMGESLEKEE